MHARKQILGLEYLRGIAALLVVIFHMKPFWDYWLPGASTFVNGGSYLGVGAFFVLSGFVMGVATESGDSALSFLAARLVRVYIPGVVATSLFLWVTSDGRGWLAAFNMMPPGGYQPYYGYGVYAVCWTLAYEILFYLIYSFAIFLSYKNRTLIAACLLALLVFPVRFLSVGKFGLGVDQGVNYDATSDIWYGIFAMSTNPIMLLFLAGLLMYQNRTALLLLAQPSAFSYACLALGAIYVALSYLYVTGHGLTNMGVGSVFLTTFFLVISSLITRPGLFGRLFWVLEKYSFSLYLMHFVAIEARYFYLPFLIDAMPFEVTRRWHTVFVMTAIGLTTWLFFQACDQPAQRLSRIVRQSIRHFEDFRRLKRI